MSRAPLVLICDHRGEGLAGIAPRLSEAGFRVEVATHLRQTCERVRTLSPDLVLVDPLVEGGEVELGALDRLRREEAPFPVLVFAERGAPSPAIRAARALSKGVWDLVYRDAPPEELALRIERLFEEARRLGELDEMRYRALHDDRTDLLRPAAFQARAEEHFSAAERHGLPLAYLLVDLDAFGQVNKAWDHTVGDRLIARVGHTIRGALRAEDVAGRLGGDEFAVLLPYTSPLEAAHVVRRLRDRIHALSGPLPGSSEGIRVGASIGFETFDGRDLDSLAELRAHAESAMRVAKRAGGNRGVYYRTLEPER
jgi:diguanylate cyclase (GGDEF)-like protein